MTMIDVARHNFIDVCESNGQYSLCCGVVQYNLDDAVGDAHHGVEGDVAPGDDHIHPELGVLGPGGIIVHVL